MATLQGIVWPEIRLLAEKRIHGLAEEGGTKAVVLEAAVLLEAGWDDMCDELWVVQIPTAVARCVCVLTHYQFSSFDPLLSRCLTRSS